MIRFENISIGYNTELFMVHDLSLYAGKVYGLIGANGVGKSTFFRSVLGQQPVLSGSIFLNGEQVNLKNIKQNSRQFAFVGPIFSGVEFLSVEDFILLGRTPYIGSMGRYAEIDKLVLEETIELFGLEHFRTLSTDKLSDGERQIASIARAFAQETDVLLLDEPTAYLDYGNKKRILQLLLRSAKEKNKTIVLSTHDIDLCLEQLEMELLIIDCNKKQMIRADHAISKVDLLEMAFSERH